ncbi:MAG: hypothetical protein KDI92_12075 [Xanthomonadales bacterium]|nr:hypothetical protein [Xanthomonadales bacterium]
MNTETRDIIKNEYGFEVICIKNFGAELLAHSIVSPSIIDVFRSLLSSEDDLCEIHVKKNPDQFVQGESISIQALRENISNQVTLLGFLDLQRNITLNPSPNQTISRGFQIIFLSNNSELILSKVK